MLLPFARKHGNNYVLVRYREIVRYLTADVPICNFSEACCWWLMQIFIEVD